MKKTRTAIFLTHFGQDCLWFCFVLMVLAIYRAAFLMVFRNTLAPDTSWSDIGWTLWYGFRISLKTAGALFLPSFVFATLLQTAWPKWKGKWFRLGLAGVCLTGLSLLFQARIPYYQEFHNAFSPFVFNTFQDDVGAIVSTSIEQYQAVWRVLAGLACSAVWVGIYYWLANQWDRVLQKRVSTIKRPAFAITVICILLIPLAVFVRKGGSFTYNGSIYWKNAARMNQHILNEAILDDVQALYKASRIYKKLAKGAHAITAEQVRTAAARLQGTDVYSSDTLLPLLKKTAPGAVLKKPTHIFVIVAETYMMWPLLDQFQSLPMANGLRRLISRPDAVAWPYVLPASNGTMFGVTSVLLGMPELNLQTANRPSAQEPYETALSVQLKKQGYKTRFFYGGFPSWENIGLFMNNQEMDESFYAADFGATGGVWGVPDRDFLAKIPRYITDEPSFNFILTSSNHPPYKVDQSREPDLPSVEDFEKMLPPETAERELTASRAWHFAYADKYLAEFVEQILSVWPDSLIVITGDHADRWTLSNSPSLYERLAVPLVFIGKGLNQQMLSKQAAVSHQDIAATVLELILPKGTTYYAFGKNAFRQQQMGVGAYYWITSEFLGEIQPGKTEKLPGVTREPDASSLQSLRASIADEQALVAWRVLHGTQL